jgi:GT2 family glycosyltransferase
MSNLKVAIVILNWNGAKLLQQFLPSVVAFSQNDGVEIWVADNGSTDDSISLLKENFPEIRILKLKQNYGFAKGYNEALRQIDADYFVVLNSDVEVTAGWLDSPIRLMETDTSIAAVQPKILSYHQKTHFEYAGAAGGFIDRFGFPFCRGRIFNEVEPDRGQYNQVTDVTWASGACMMIRAKQFAENGGFDADFWAHMEEIDLCWRLKNRRFRIVFDPSSTVYHVGGGTLSYDNPQKLYLNFRNNLWLLYKNLPSGKLFPVLFFRMFLDGLAALKLLAEFNFNGIRSVFMAHVHFYLSLPKLHRKRKALKNHLSGKQNARSAKSIVWQFYFRKRKTYTEIFR